MGTSPSHSHLPGWSESDVLNLSERASASRFFAATFLAAVFWAPALLATVFLAPALLATVFLAPAFLVQIPATGLDVDVGPEHLDERFSVNGLSASGC
jgi:low temperature requirement protein LtrA